MSTVITGSSEHAPPARSACVLEVKGVSKSFGRIRVLDRISFDLRAGEVHVLAGENGAGKSTLVKILSGALDGYEGEILLDGAPVRLRNPGDAAKAGIVTIHQELSLIPAMSVVDNLFLAPKGGEGLFSAVPRRKQAEEAARIIAAAGLAIDPTRAVGDYPLSVQQLIEIARALAAGARVLLLDEPTSALNEAESNALIERIMDLRLRGAALLYISHRMDEIYTLADRITVLRDGTVAGTASPAALPRDRLIAWMIGRDLAAPAGSPRRAATEAVLRVEGLRVARKDAPGRFDVEDASLSVARGEVVGLAGLRGAGASQLLHAIFDSSGRASGRIAGGTLELGGVPLSNPEPRASLRRGIALLTSDRKSTGIFMDLNIIENATLASLDRYTASGFLSRAAERAATSTIMPRLKLRASSLDAPAAALSGGNQQKVYLARCLLAEPKLLLLDEPTRGVDVAAKADIYEFIRGLAENGAAILLTTSEMDELLLLCDRILVMHRGRVVASMPREEATREKILSAAMGRREGDA